MPTRYVCGKHSAFDHAVTQTVQCPIVAEIGYLKRVQHP